MRVTIHTSQPDLPHKLAGAHLPRPVYVAEVCFGHTRFWSEGLAAAGAAALRFPRLGAAAAAARVDLAAAAARVDLAASAASAAANAIESAASEGLSRAAMAASAARLSREYFIDSGSSSEESQISSPSGSSPSGSSSSGLPSLESSPSGLNSSVVFSSPSPSS